MTTYGVGIYPASEISQAGYHAGLFTPEPALSSSIIKTLLNQSPEHARDRHPRLTQSPEYDWPQTDAQKIGSVCHAMLLDAGERYKVFRPEDYRTANGDVAKTLGCKEAQIALEEWRSGGGIDINDKTYRNAKACTDRMMTEILADYPMWPEGRSEMTIVFQYRLNDGSHVWCKARPDRIIERCVCAEASGRHLHLFDPKTTGRQATDGWIDKTAEIDGWGIQDAFYSIGAEHIAALNVSGEYSTSPRFTFIVGESYPPYATRFVTLPEHWRSDCRLDVDRAANIWGACLKSGEWPSSRLRHYEAMRPEWAGSKLATLIDAPEE